MEGCGLCGAPSALRCGNCGRQTYCGKPHQRQHWPQHRLVCRSPGPAWVETEKSAYLGRHLTATAQIPEERLLFKDAALVAGPPCAAPPMCLGCLRAQVAARCRRCSAPLCHPKCQHSSPECDALRTASPPLFAATAAAAAAAAAHSDWILPLRCLCNVRKQTPGWSEFLQLEAHLEVRRQLPVWRERKLRVVQVLKRHGLISADGSEDDMVQRICGILDVNSFEVRGPDGGLVRAIFPRAALMAHSCTPNVHVAVDDRLEMTVRAAKAISKGDTLFYCYTSILQGTAARQEHLWEGKYFRCGCGRCGDPTEFGTHLSSIWCPRCVVGLVVPVHGVHLEGAAPPQLPATEIVAKAKAERRKRFRKLPSGMDLVLPTKLRQPNARYRWSSSDNPSSESARTSDSWQCWDCKYRFSSAMVRTVERLSMDIVDSAAMQCTSDSTEDDDCFVDHLEAVVTKLQHTLSPQHAVVVHAKQLLGGAYRDRIREKTLSNGRPATLKHLSRAADLCKELCDILHKLEGGAISRNTGIALHALHEPLLLALSKRKAEGTQLTEGLSEIRQILVAALRHLRVEPAESPEGQLAAAAFAQLADIENRLRMTANDQEAKRRRNKTKNRRR